MINVDDRFFFLKSFNTKNCNSLVDKNFCVDYGNEIIKGLEKINENLRICNIVKDMDSLNPHFHAITKRHIKQQILHIVETEYTNKLMIFLEQTMENSRDIINDIKMFQVGLSSKMRVFYIHFSANIHKKKVVYPVLLDVNHCINLVKKDKSYAYNNKIKHRKMFFEIKDKKCMIKK